MTKKGRTKQNPAQFFPI